MASKKNAAAKNRISDAQKLHGATSIIKNKPALMTDPKTVFDERIKSLTQEKDDHYYDALISDKLQIKLHEKINLTD